MTDIGTLRTSYIVTFARKINFGYSARRRTTLFDVYSHLALLVRWSFPSNRLGYTRSDHLYVQINRNMICTLFIAPPPLWKNDSLVGVHIDLLPTTIDQGYVAERIAVCNISVCDQVISLCVIMCVITLCV